MMNKYQISILLFLVIILFASCEFSTENQSENNNNDTTIVSPGYFTYKLAESNSYHSVWTIPPARKLKISDVLPEIEQSGIKICAAKNEFEPFQIILSKSSSNCIISISNFDGLPDDQRIEINKIGFKSGHAETLTPLEQNQQIFLSSSQLNGFWITIYVPKSAIAGEYFTELKFNFSDGSEEINIPIRLKVFDFMIPETINFYSQFNVSLSSKADHNLLYEHRLTPKSATWPSSFSYNITWPSPYNYFYDEFDQREDYSIKYLAKKYIHGENWFGNGYPTAMGLTFVNNNTPRPNIFAGVNIGSSQYGTPQYNQEWQKYLSALDNYLTENNYQDKVYYYLMNEPQNTEDDNLAAYLLNLTREVAPNLRLAISEQAKPEIAENNLYPPVNGKSYDIWISEVMHFDQSYAWGRMDKYNEEVWFYSLPQDSPPFFNPTLSQNEGMNVRIIPWCSWYHRVRGWAYYDGSNFFDNKNPNIRMELLREGWEDYEYLYLANNNNHPLPYLETDIDLTVYSVTNGATSWTKNADALQKLKWELGAYIEGDLSTPPILETEVVRPRGEYYINFQNPESEPTDNPLIVDGKTYFKIGWTKYNEIDYYGFLGFAIENPFVQKYNYRDVPGYNELQKSYLYDDYGKINTFEFDLENGKYQVTLGIGRPEAWTADLQNVIIENEIYFDYESNLASTERTKIVTIADGKLTVTFGDAVGQYTFMAYLKIIPND